MLREILATCLLSGLTITMMPVVAAQSGTSTTAATASTPSAMPYPSVVQAGYMTPDTTGNFHAERVVTRAELAMVLVKTFGLAKRVPSKTPPADIPDVPATHWAYDAIRTVLSTNVMEGYYTNTGDGRFFPAQPLTRAEGFAIFAQADGVYPLSDEDVNQMLSPYADADKLPAWTRKAIATALKEGFINIDVATMEPTQQNLRPNDPLTRGDLAFALSRFIDRKSQANAGNPSKEE
jgi:hypothetical protein